MCRPNYGDMTCSHRKHISTSTPNYCTVEIFSRSLHDKTFTDVLSDVVSGDIIEHAHCICIAKKLMPNSVECIIPLLIIIQVSHFYTVHVSMKTNQKLRSLIWERDKWTREIPAQRLAAVRLELSLPVVVAKAYAVHTT